MVKTSTVGVRGLAAIVVTLAAGVWACGESHVALGGGQASVNDACTRSSECAPSLVCSFSRCHEECTTTADCSNGQRCVGAGNGVRVCQLPAEAQCGGTASCADGQLCSADNQCREACTSDTACPYGQRCTAAGVCAEPVEVDENGNLKIPGGSPTPVGSSTVPPQGSGGATSTAPSSGTTASAGATNDHPSASGGMNAGGTASSEGGAGGDPDVEEGGAGAGGQTTTMNPVVVHETCDDADRGNATRDKALSIALNTKVQSCFQTDADAEYFEFTVPEAPQQGGYVVVSATDVNFNGAVDMTVESAADDLPIRVWKGLATEDVYGWFAASPGSTYRVLLKPNMSTGRISYVFRARFSGVPDEYAPNQTRDTAKRIEVGDSIQAFTFAGHATSEAPMSTAFEDWYMLRLEAGKIEARLDPAADVRGRITLYRSTGEYVTDTFQGNPGVTLTLTKSKLVAGDYYLRVDNFSDPPASSGEGPTPPPHATNPYTFTITQPL
ncbi:MAG TPA: hypothetical protein VFQ61_10825 [Polyangiaceae bacterium]|nr:hypothetical protein [Polyangiaceae bacterium]